MEDAEGGCIEEKLPLSEDVFFVLSLNKRRRRSMHPEAPFASLFIMRSLPSSYLPRGHEANPSLILFSVPSRMLRVTPTLKRCAGGNCECEKSSDVLPLPLATERTTWLQTKQACTATLFAGPRKWMNKHLTKKNVRFHLLSPYATTTCLKVPAIKMHAALHTTPHPRPSSH